LANKDHHLAGWEVTNQLLLGNLKDQLDEIVTLLSHELRYFVANYTSDQVHLSHNLAVGRTSENWLFRPLFSQVSSNFAVLC
jgi:hypothetical protein